MIKSIRGHVLGKAHGSLWPTKNRLIVGRMSSHTSEHETIRYLTSSQCYKRVNVIARNLEGEISPKIFSLKNCTKTVETL